MLEIVASVKHSREALTWAAIKRRGVSSLPTK